MNKNSEIFYSVVIPVYNEEASLSETIMRIEGVLEGLRKSYEIILVNDGSSDNSWQMITENNKRNPNIKGVSFSRNFGHQVALVAGLRASIGKMVAFMDADAQDPPELLPDFFNKCKEGFDVVYGIRKRPTENILKKVCYFIFYRILNRIASIEIPLDAGDFSVINRKTADLLISFKEHNPFIRGLRCWAGGKFIGIEYERYRRKKGKSKYSLMKLARLAIVGLISFSNIPLRISIFAGVIVSSISFTFGIINILRYLLFQTPFIGFATIVVIISFIGGFQLIMLGVIGEYIVFIFDEIKRRPLYIVDTTVGIDKTTHDIYS